MIIFLILLFFMLTALMLVPARRLRTWSYSGLLLLVGFVNIALVWTCAGNEKLSLMFNTFFIFSYAYILDLYSRAWLRESLLSINLIFAMAGMMLLIVMHLPGGDFPVLQVLAVLALLLLLPAVGKIWTIKSRCRTCSKRKQDYLRLAAVMACCPMVIYALILVVPRDNFILAYNPVLSASQTVAVIVTGLYVVSCVVYIQNSKARKITTPVIGSGIRSLT